MLVEMAAMSLDDGLVLQLHAGSWRRPQPDAHRRASGRDKGADIPKPMDYVGALKPLLDRFGNEPALTVVVYTLDESTYSRELAPLAGHYPALRLGPPWWFHDSPEGIRRFRQLVTETAGFANTVGFNDDARSLLTHPGPPRHGPPDRRRLPRRSRRRAPPRRGRSRRGRRRPRLRPRPRRVPDASDADRDR